MNLLKTTTLLLLLGLIPALSSCIGRVGIEPAEGLIFDNTDGTMYVDPEFMKDFSQEKLQNFRRFETHKVVIPAPFTFGTLSFAWGQISINRIMEEAKFKKLVYAHYKRLSVVTVYTNYEIIAYGE
jgi:hypothetical protein